MKTFMKTSFLFIMLLFALQAISAVPEQSDAAKGSCCYGVSDTVRIPLKLLQSYNWTSSTCPQKHIVFVTIKKKHICANPENEWAKKAKNT